MTSSNDTSGGDMLRKAGAAASSALDEGKSWVKSEARQAQSAAGEALHRGRETASELLQKGKETASEALRDSREAISRQAHDAARQAKERVSGMAEEQMSAASQHLETFAQAIRKASDDLAANEQTTAARLVQQAAGGLESLSRTISNSSLDDMIGSVRQFGRQNPVAFVGGALLIGVALGRFFRASSERGQPRRYRGSYRGESDWQGMAHDPGYADRGHDVQLPDDEPFPEMDEGPEKPGATGFTSGASGLAPSSVSSPSSGSAQPSEPLKPGSGSIGGGA